MNIRNLSVCFGLIVVSATGCSTFDSTPEATLSWEQRLTTQQLYFSAPNYWWSTLSQSEVNKALDTMLAEGADGPSIEFCGPATADEYNKKNTAATAERVDVTYRKNIKIFKDRWLPGLKKRGQVVKLSFCNTNTKRNNTISDGEWKNLANEFVDACGVNNMLVLPYSETDPRTRSSIRSVLDQTFRARGARVVRYGGTSGLRECHSQRGNDIPRGNKDLIVSSDSGPCIGYLYGGSWQGGGSPNEANITAYATTTGNNGGSCEIYNFNTKFDAKGCKIAGKAWGKR